MRQLEKEEMVMKWVGMAQERGMEEDRNQSISGTLMSISKSENGRNEYLIQTPEEKEIHMEKA